MEVTSLRSSRRTRRRANLMAQRSWGLSGLVFSLFCQVSIAQELPSIPETIVVDTREVPPFAMKDEAGKWSGLSIDLLREVKVDLESQAEHPIKFEFREKSLEDMLDDVERGTVDLAAAAITVNYDREKRMDFTHPYFNSGLGIAVRADQKRSGWVGVMESLFSGTFFQIIIALFAGMFVCAITLYVFERRKNAEDFGGGPVRGITSALWWAAVTLTTVGYGDKVPKTVAGRLIGLIWMFAGLFIVASFTAAVTATLTVTQLKSRVSGPGDLPRVKVASVVDSTSAQYLQTRQIRFRNNPDIATALEALKTGRCEAVVYDAPVLRHTVLQDYADTLFVLPASFERQNYAFALPHESELRERINQVVLRVTSQPDWQETLTRYFGNELEM